jgi:phosphatidylinositol N-acetylglucosaminyltransferase subunit Q
MHPFSTLTIGIFVAGYITARWDLVTRLYELAIFAWDHGVIARAAKGFAILSLFFFLFIVPADRLAQTEIAKVSPVRPEPPRLLTESASSPCCSGHLCSGAIKTPRLDLACA